MTRSRPTRRSIVVASLVGVLHGCIVLWVYAHMRQQSVMTTFTGDGIGASLWTVWILLGLVILGGTPVILFTQYRLIGPLAALVSIYGVSAYMSFQTLSAAREVGATPSVTLRPDSAYILLWMFPLFVVLLIGGIEYLLRSKHDSPIASSRTE